MPDHAELPDAAAEPGTRGTERRETEWLAAHVFYHAPLEPVITDVISPLVTELTGLGLADEYFFLRYWDSGPHLRFRVLPPDGPSRHRSRTLVERRIRRFLDTRPAATTIDEAEYRRTAEPIARLENEPGYSPLRPNNSVAFLPYRRERLRYGYGAAITAVERHFTESSRIALGLLASGPDPDQRFTAAFSMLTLAWLCGTDDPAARLGGAGKARTNVGALDAGELERLWHDQRDTLCTLIESLRAVVARSDALGSGDLADWVRSLDRLRRVLDAEAAAGRYVPPTPGGAGGAPAGPAPASLPAMDICAHLFCNRIGLSLAGESYVRALAMRAIRETETETGGGPRAVAGDSCPLQ
ncbi:lantibiotic dehydratase C-terminal domain-containing protein [Streptomonospora wellingtoniae]|uniref:Lantibiotic dehydratase C-terminal domain-containing protein n=1 Tax=Streptomonospora wellingtoniae TaxID=3075544 RepID=A0ABU2KWB8_9ACTN|nr:lantibiotic dehydratase C-terminal domain-containing protein [Streptomonospora sp. DSM 45055]MDT0303591.1 lantibiotic dehydratase C-terminal domain-containing protein [Streptomonospora sp. DSM 45055]